jgi:hypothetical protein
MDTTDSLLAERRHIRELLASWWRRWDANYKAAVGGSDSSIALMPIDDWARETPDETAHRIGSGPDWIRDPAHIPYNAQRGFGATDAS